MDKTENDNPQGWPRFLTSGDTPVMLALTRGGHSASVGTMESTEGKGTPLHPRFHRMAVLQGCMPVGLQGAADKDDLDVAAQARMDRAGLLRKAIAEMVSEAAEDATKQSQYFTSDGRPDARAMAVKLGFPVSASERDAAWQAYGGDEE